jgi:hypothetical protein
MHKNMQDKNAQNMQVSWESVLVDAEEAFRKTRTHGNKLRRAISEIKKKISANAPFPLGRSNNVSTHT